jgi:hypothetical protein
MLVARPLMLTVRFRHRLRSLPGAHSRALSVVILTSAANSVFKLTVSLRQLCRGNPSAQEHISSAWWLDTNILPQMKLLHLQIPSIRYCLWGELDTNGIDGLYAGIL